MKVSGSDPNVLYVGTLSQGLFTMRNGGATWRVVLPNTEINAIAPGRQTPGLLYVATGSGLYRSTDDGSTWDVQNQEWAGRDVTAVTLATHADHIVFVAVQGMGVYQSLDAGVTWVRLNRGIGREEVRALISDPTHLDTVYAGTASGLWRSVTGEVVRR